MERNTDLQARLRNSRAKIHQDVRDGVLPPPIRLGSRWSAWPSDEIDQIIRARVAGWSRDRIRELVKELIVRRQTEAPMQGRIDEPDDDEPQAVVPRLQKPKATRRPVSRVTPRPAGA